MIFSIHDIQYTTIFSISMEELALAAHPMHYGALAVFSGEALFGMNRIWGVWPRGGSSLVDPAGFKHEIRISDVHFSKHRNFTGPPRVSGSLQVPIA